MIDLTGFSIDWRLALERVIEECEKRGEEATRLEYNKGGWSAVKQKGMALYLEEKNREARLLALSSQKTAEECQNEALSLSRSSSLSNERMAVAAEEQARIAKKALAIAIVSAIAAIIAIIISIISVFISYHSKS